MKLFVRGLALLTVLCSVSHAQWQPSSNGTSPEWSLANRSVYTMFEKDSFLFAGTDNGVYRSSDLGHTWKGHHTYHDRFSSQPTEGVHIKDFLSRPHRYFLDHPKWLWVDQLLSQTDSIAMPAMATDPDGNAILATIVNGSCNFDEEDSITVSPSGILIMKVDSNGKILWRKSALTPQGLVTVTAVACDSAGNSFILGGADTWIYQTPRTIDFGGTTITTGKALRSFFVASYDPSGAFRWAKMATVDTIADASGIAADPLGNVYVSGTFIGTLSMGTAKHVTNRDDLCDAFVTRLSGIGTGVWIVQSSSKFHTSTYDNNPNQASCNGICVDPAGNSYIFGQANDTEFVANQLIAGGMGYMAYVAKYDRFGNGIWAVPFLDHELSSAYHEAELESITCDHAGNIVFAMKDQDGQIVLNDTAYVTDLGGIYSALDSSGHTRWVKYGPIVDSQKIVCDAAGNLYLNFAKVYTPSLYDWITWGNDTLYRKNNIFGEAGCVLKVRRNGSVEWSNFEAQPTAICARRDGSVYALTGTYNIFDNQRFGRLGYGGTIGISRLSAQPPGWTIDTDLIAGTGAGSYLSVNNGRSWLLNRGHNESWEDLGYGGNQLALIDTVLYGTRSDGKRAIYKTTDYGEVWDSIATPQHYTFLRTSGTSLIADGIARSDDFGKTWTTDPCAIRGGMNLNIGERWVIDSGLIAGADRNWFWANVGIDGYTSNKFALESDSKALAYYGNLLFDGTTALNVSDNFGETWHAIDDGLPRMGGLLDYRVLSLYELGNEVLIGTNSGGIFRRPLSEIRSKIYDVVPTFISAAQGHAQGDAVADAVAVGADGSSVMLGHFAGTLQLGNFLFDHHQGTKRGGVDYFIAQYNPSGSISWALQIQADGLADTAYPLALSVSRNGEIYVAGHFSSILTAGNSTLHNKNGLRQTFLLKCSPDGSVAWLDTLASSRSFIKICQIAADSNGDVAIAGEINGGYAIKGISLSGNSSTEQSFAALVGADGTAKWARRLAPIAPIASVAYAIAVTPNGHYVVGGGARDSGLFLTTLDNNGKQLDSSFAGRSYFDYVSSLGIDRAGNAYAQLAIADTVTLGVSTLIGGNYKRFLAQYNGHWNWAKMVGAQRSNARPGALPTLSRTSTTPDGTTYVIGLDSVTGQPSFERTGGNNHVSKFDATGQYMWTKQLSSNYACDVYALATDNAGAVWTAGEICTDRKNISTQCYDMAFGLLPLAPSPIDSSTRPFIAHLGTSSVVAPLFVAKDEPAVHDFVRVFPNPTSGPITIIAHPSEHAQLTVSLFDALGRELQRESYSPMIDTFETQCDFHPPAGSYLLRVTCGHEVRTVPIVVQ